MKNHLRTALEKLTKFGLLGLTLLVVASTAVTAGPLAGATAAFIVMAGTLAIVQPLPTAAVRYNTLTSLIPDFYAALDVVSRELVGFIPSVQRDPRADRCALNATMRSHVAPASTASDVTPAMSVPSASYQTIANKSFTIQKSRYVPFSWTGEEQGNVNIGPGYLTIQQDQIAQAIRTLVNEIEVDIATYGYKGASRAYGTAATTPFASDLSASAQVRKILDDNGAPLSGRSLIIDTAAGAALRTLGQLTKANEAGTGMTLRDGELLNLQGFSVKESAQVQTPTKGTGASYLVNNASGYAIGDTTIAADTGSGTILAGDVVTFTGDTNKYVVTTALSGGSFTIAAPGLRKALADNVAITVGNTATQNLAFSQNAILLGTRLPALPSEGDMATDRTVITDPRSGLSFELACYPGYRMITYHVSIAWGVAVLKPEHLAVLLG